jgi:chromosome segregation ATPase
VDALTAQKEELSAQLVTLDHTSEADKKHLEIREAQLELSTLESENKAYRDHQTVGSVNVHDLNIRVTSLQTQLTRKRNEFSNENSNITDLDKRISEARAAWFSLNNETFTGDTCLSCGQQLPADKLQKAKEDFDANKKSQLCSIEESANYHKQQKALAEDRLNRQQEDIKQLEAEIAELQAQITAAEATKVEPKDMADYAQRKGDIQGRIDKLNADLIEIQENVSGLKTKLQEEISLLRGKISEKMGVISTQNLLEYSRKRVEELRQDAKNAAECLEAIEKMLYLMDEYSRYKTRFVEDSINGLFRIARFRLFREQANGGVEDRCDVVYDGIPYISVNNGMKINLGIDIINTLSTAYGVRVPLFVDNAESVTKLEKCGSQIIRLVVSENDKELRVNYEN